MVRMPMIQVLKKLTECREGGGTEACISLGWRKKARKTHKSRPGLLYIYIGADEGIQKEGGAGGRWVKSPSDMSLLIKFLIFLFLLFLLFFLFFLLLFIFLIRET